MADNESAVEGFKLTKEQRAWYGHYKKLHKVTEMIKKGLRIEFGKVQALQQLLDQSQGVKSEMMKGAPTNPINEIEGQGGMQR